MRWKDDPEFQTLAQPSDEDEEPSLETLVPKAFKLLDRAMSDGGISAARARIALDILTRAASLVGKSEDGESPLEKRLAEIESLRVQYEPD